METLFRASKRHLKWFRKFYVTSNNFKHLLKFRQILTRIWRLSIKCSENKMIYSEKVFCVRFGCEIAVQCVNLWAFQCLNSHARIANRGINAFLLVELIWIGWVNHVIFWLIATFLLRSLRWRGQGFWPPPRSGSGRTAEAKSLAPSSAANGGKSRY